MRGERHRGQAQQASGDDMVRTAVVMAVALVVAACGGRPSGDFTDQPGNAIARAAVDDMVALKSVRMVGSLVYAGHPEMFDFLVDTAGDCRGTASVGPLRIRLIAVHGQVWLKPNLAFFEHQAPGHGRELQAKVGNHWLAEHETPLRGVCDLDTFVTAFRASGTDPEATKVGQVTVDGQPTVGIRGHGNGGETVTGWVATTGRHHLIELQVVGGTSPGIIRFSDFDHPVGAQEPDPSDVVDLAASQG